MPTESSCISFFWSWLIVGNPLLILWHHYYVLATLHPLSHITRAAGTLYSNMRLEFIFIVLFGVFFIFINGGFGAYYIVRPVFHRWDSAASRVQRTLWTGVLGAAVAVAAVMGVVMFVAPFVVVEWRWRAEFKSACEGMETRVLLDMGGRPAEVVGFVDLVGGGRYGMRLEPDPGVEGYDERGVYGFSVVEGTENSSFVPGWESVRYDMGAQSYSVVGEDGGVVRRGEFALGRNFRVTGLAVWGDLERYGERCVFDPTVVVKDRDGRVVVRTVQFGICEGLQVCAEGDVEDLGVLVGLLVLIRAERGGKCCKGGRRMPGLEGRD